MAERERRILYIEKIGGGVLVIDTGRMPRWEPTISKPDPEDATRDGDCDPEGPPSDKTDGDKP